MDIKDKVILVTGSSSGIGRAIAIECSKAGAEVLIHYRKNKEGAEETLREVNKYSKGKIFCADLSKQDDVQNMFVGIKTLDVLVNNAGEYRPGEIDNKETWDHQLNNIFLSNVRVTDAFLKTSSNSALRKIVNISSVYGLFEMGNPNAVQYSCAKAAVSSLTETLAAKLAPGILVNAVAPGYTMTPGWDGTSEEDLKASANQNAIKRFIEPEEIASMVLELIKNDAVTGEIVRVDGGIHLPKA